MSMIVPFTALSPLYVAIAWAIYLGAKWIAAFVAASEIDQAILGVMAALIIMGVGLSALIEVGRD
jgi:hypothetical protein